MELERTGTKVDETESRNSSLEAFLFGSCGLIADLNQRIRLRRLLATQFKEWRAVVAWRKHERGLQKKAEDWYVKDVLPEAINTDYFWDSLT